MALTTKQHRIFAVAAIGISAGLLATVLAIYFNRGFVPGDAVVYLAGGERLNADHQLYALAPGDRTLGMKPPYWTVPDVSRIMGPLNRSAAAPERSTAS